MKKILILSLIIFTCIYVENIYANENKTNITVNNRVCLDDCISNNNHLFINYNDASYYLGANGFYDRNAKQFTFKRVDDTITMTLNSPLLYANDKSMVMDTAPVSLDGNLYVPIRPLSDALGYSLEWNSELKTLNIDTKGILPFYGGVQVPLENVDISNIHFDKIYDEDYITIYKNVFDNMFSKGWKVLNTKKYLVETFDDDGGVYRYIYTQWEIEYVDYNDSNKNFTFKNKIPIYENIEALVKNLAETHYYRYVDKYFNTKDVSCKLTFDFTGGSLSVSRPPEIAYSKYMNKILTDEGAIDVSNLNCDDIFNQCPVYMDISIKYIEKDKNKAIKYDNIYSNACNMINDINVHTGNKANLCLYINYNDEKPFKQYYINGQIVEIKNVLYYMSDLTYEVYKDTIFDDIL